MNWEEVVKPKDARDWGLIALNLKIGCCGLSGRGGLWRRSISKENNCLKIGEGQVGMGAKNSP